MHYSWLNIHKSEESLQASVMHKCVIRPPHCLFFTRINKRHTMNVKPACLKVATLLSPCRKNCYRVVENAFIDVVIFYLEHLRLCVVNFDTTVVGTFSVGQSITDVSTTQ